jgi:hypothetical protein
MSMRLDFSKVKDGSLEDGEYAGIVTSIGRTVKDDKVSVYFNVWINGQAYKSKYYSLNDKALVFLKRALTNLGVDTTKAVDLDTNPGQGVKAIFRVASREFNGKTYKDLTPVKYLGEATDAERLEAENTPF